MLFCFKVLTLRGKTRMINGRGWIFAYPLRTAGTRRRHMLRLDFCLSCADNQGDSDNMELKKIGIIGLGLIGGSLAKTIHLKMPDVQIRAVEPDALTRETALQENNICRAFPELTAEFFDCDCIFLCAEVQNNVHLLTQIAENIKPGTILSDVSSVKAEIIDAIRAAGLSPHFIGGHPMAGSEKNGYGHSSAYLFENAYYLLTPEPEVPKEAVAAFMGFLKELQTLPLMLSADYHDYSTAAISHFPHVLAASLVNLVREIDDSDETMKHIAAGGFKDITRIASSPPEMWRQICLANKTQIMKMLDLFQDNLKKMEEMLENGNGDGIYSFFESAKEYRDSIRITSDGSILRTFHLYCDLIDEAGGIATIATILATNHLSIKNIGIIHNREFEDGVLQIEFYDEESLNRAVALLKKHHYSVYER